MIAKGIIGIETTAVVAMDSQFGLLVSYLEQAFKVNKVLTIIVSDASQFESIVPQLELRRLLVRCYEDIRNVGHRNEGLTCDDGFVIDQAVSFLQYPSWWRFSQMDMVISLSRLQFWVSQLIYEMGSNWVSHSVCIARKFSRSRIRLPIGMKTRTSTDLVLQLDRSTRTRYNGFYKVE